MAEVQAQAYEYVVEGTGQFPLDMLRHDRAWTKSTQDAVLLDPHERGVMYNQKRQITLIGLREPTEGRWRSFGWPVVKFDRTRVNVTTMPKSRAR